MNHILMQCSYAREVWFKCLRGAGLQLPLPQTDSILELWWSETMKRVLIKGGTVSLVAWLLRKQRNARVFANVNQQCSTD